MTKSFPYLALDSAGRRTILCDHPVPMFGDNTTKKETKMAHVMTNREVESHTKKLVARLLGQDAAVDDETAARIKEFLSDKLSDKDHTALCAMLSGDDVDAQDTEPDDVELPKNAIGRAADARTVAAFNKQFPDAAKINIDSSGIQPRKRPASGDMASFNAMFPDAAKIKVL